ncbi:MAG: hypothetical protein ACJ8CB_31630 [Ktedonobacteraceae bacterium]
MLSERQSIDDCFVLPFAAGANAGASVTGINTGEVVELFDGGWLQLGADLSQPRIEMTGIGKKSTIFIARLFGGMETIGWRLSLLKDVDCLSTIPLASSIVNRRVGTA